MILVTVGTHDRPFDRLIKAMDELAAGMAEPVVIQRGVSSILPQHAAHFDFTTGRRMEELAAVARVIVAHAAAGSIILALKSKKPLVIVPRLRQVGEVIDDHQTQLANALHNSGRACAVNPVTSQSLSRALQMAPNLQAKSVTGAELITALRRQLNLWSANGSRPDAKIVRSGS